jgi:hypothetical protein
MVQQDKYDSFGTNTQLATNQQYKQAKKNQDIPTRDATHKISRAREMNDRLSDRVFDVAVVGTGFSESVLSG